MAIKKGVEERSSRINSRTRKKNSTNFYKMCNNVYILVNSNGPNEFAIHQGLRGFRWCGYHLAVTVWTSADFPNSNSPCGNIRLNPPGRNFPAKYKFRCGRCAAWITSVWWIRTRNPNPHEASHASADQDISTSAPANWFFWKALSSCLSRASFSQFLLECWDPNILGDSLSIAASLSISNLAGL